MAVIPFSTPGIQAYKGAAKSIVPSADGAYFWAFCHEGKRGFGMYVFRTKKGEETREIEYGPLLTERGILSVGGNGVLYVTGSNKDGREILSYTVPGYVPFTHPASGTTGATTPATQPIVDSSAALREQIARLEQRVAQLEKVSHLNMLSAQQIETIAWNKANDAIYASTQNGHLLHWVWAKASDAAYALLKNHNLIR